MKRSVAFTFPIVLLIAILSATLITGCDSSGDPTPTVTPTPTVIPGTPTPTVIPSPTDTPTPSPDVPAECIKTLKVLRGYNDPLVDFIYDSGFLENMTEEKETFIVDGLGRNGLWGVGLYASENDILMKIVENEQFAIETVQLKGGEKDILVMYGDISLLEPYMEWAKVSSPLTEKFLGVPFPNDTVAVYVRTIDSIASGFNGTLTLTANLNNPYAVRQDTHEEIHAFWETSKGESPGGGTLTLINEGLAELGAYVVLEEISQTMPGFLDESFSIQSRYDAIVRHLKEDGLYGLPLSEILTLNYSAKETGFYILKDLRDLMGADAFTDGLAAIYYYKEPKKGLAVDQEILHEYMREHAPDKAAVDHFFEERVFGN